MSRVVIKYPDKYCRQCNKIIITKRTSDIKKRIFCSEPCRRNWLKTHSPAVNLSKESRKKMSLAKIGYIPWNKGIPCSEDLKNKLCSILKGRKISEEWALKNSLGHKGKKHYNWKGGSYNNRLTDNIWRKARGEAYNRDEYTCQICGIRYCDKNRKGLHAHHIIPYRISKNDSLDNLITLCSACHVIEERKYYKSVSNSN